MILRHYLKICEIVVYISLVYAVGHNNTTTPRPPEVDYLDDPDFLFLVERPTFVDKTMFIREFLEGPPRILITAPHEFGKSTNLDMVRRFLSIPSSTTQSDDNLGGKEKNLTEDCKIFLRHNLKIYQDKEFFYKHCGQYPVIYLDFLQLLVYEYEELLSSLRHAVYLAFRHHDYLVENIGPDMYIWTSERMHGEEVEKFRAYWDKEKFKVLNEHQLKKSMFYLSRLLHTYHNKKVTVLIDEFDSVWLKVINQVDSKLKKSSEFIARIIFILFGSNPHINNILLMSCMRYGSVVTLGKIKSIKVFEFNDDHRYAKYFGLTTPEVKNLMSQLYVPDNLTQVRVWYNGYRVEKQNLTLYNTWSVIHYLHSGILKPYGYGFAYIHNLRKLAMVHKIRENLFKLAHGSSVQVKLFNEPPNTDSLYDMRTVLGHPREIWRMEEHWNDFLMYLYECRVVQRVRFYKNSTTVMKVVVPNLELVQSLFQYLYSRPYFEKHFKFKTSRMTAFLDCFNTLGRGTNDTLKLFLYFTKTIARLHTFARLPDDTYAFAFSFYYPFKLTRVYPVVDIEVSPSIYGKERRNYLTVIRDDGTAIIMQMRYGRSASADEAIIDIIESGHYKILDRRPDFRQQLSGTYIYIGVYMDQKKLVEVCYLVNSTNLKKKRCITNGMNLGIPLHLVAQIKSYMHYYMSVNSTNGSVIYVPRFWQNETLTFTNSSERDDDVISSPTDLVHGKKNIKSV